MKNQSQSYTTKMGKIRQLSDEEKFFWSKRIRELEERRAYSVFLIELADFTMFKALPMNFKRQMEENRQKKRDAVEECKEFDVSIGILRQQLMHGVEEKDGNNNNRKKSN